MKSIRDLAEELNTSKSKVQRLRIQGLTDEDIEKAIKKESPPPEIEEEPMVEKKSNRILCDECKGAYEHFVNECRGCGKEVNGDLICLCLECCEKLPNQESVTYVGSKGKTVLEQGVSVQLEKEFEPNWKRNGFKTREKALEHLMELLVTNPKLKGVEVMIGGHVVKCGSKTK